MNIRQLDVKTVVRALRSRDYPVFGGTDAKPRDFDPTFFGVRTNIGGPTGQSSQAADGYDDFLGCLYREHGRLSIAVVPGSTDPGLAALRRPRNAKGVAILKPGHYPKLWTRGRHSKLSNAFRQNAPCTVYRDRDRDHYLDMGPDVPTETGVFWINMHPSTYVVGRKVRRAKIGPWGEGCQITANWTDFALLRAIRDEQVRRHGWRETSYSLLTALDF